MLQVYTGNGKGKTTAAIGLAIRALGAGQRVYIMQFMKSLAYSEQKILKGLAPSLQLAVTGKPFFVVPEGRMDEASREKWGKDVVLFPPGQPPAAYVQILLEGLQRVSRDVKSHGSQLVILDEINVVLSFGLLPRAIVEPLLDELLPDIEVVCTGRDAPAWLQARADLITEMKELRHYYTRGIEARRGIEN